MVHICTNPCRVLVNKRDLPMLLLSIVGDDIAVPYRAILGLISSVPKQSDLLKSRCVRGFTFCALNRRSGCRLD